MRRTLGAVLVVALLAAGCAGEEVSVVQTALDRPVKSARVALRVSVERAGAEVARLSVRGPVRSNGEERLPSFDWRLRIAEAGRTVSARIASTGRNVFVRYRGTTYEVGERRTARLGRRTSGGVHLGDAIGLARLGVIDLGAWFPDSAGEPRNSRVAGVATRKVAGRLDVSAALEQLAPLLARPDVRGQLGVRLPVLGPREIALIDALISDPRFELEAGRDDGKLRRLAARFRVSDPRGPATATVRVELRLTAVDEPVRIVAPASGRPIGRLLERLGLVTATPRRG